MNEAAKTHMQPVGVWNELRQYTPLFDAFPIPATLIDAEGIVVDVNQAFLNLAHAYGHEIRKEDRIGGHIASFAATEEERTRFRAFIDELLGTGKAQHRLWPGENASGQRQFRDIRATVIKDTAGGVVGALVLREDVSERKQSEERQRLLQRVREEVWKMQGGKDIDRVLATIGPILTVREISFLAYAINLVVDPEDEYPVHVYIHDPDGKQFLAPLRRDQAETQIILEAWKSEKVLYRPDLAQENLYGEHLNPPQQPHHARVRSAIDVPFSRGTLSLASARPCALSEENIFFLAELAQVVDGGFQRAEDLQRLEQRNRELEQEIREHKRTEESLREREDRLRSVMESSVDAIVVGDHHGNIILWNKAAQVIFDYAPDEVLGKSLSMLMPERFREAHRKGLVRNRSTGESSVIGKTVEMQGLRKDGHEFPLELSLGRWEIEGEVFYSGIIRDITERKRIEIERERFRTLLDSAGVAIYLADAEDRGRFVDFNETAYRQLGYSSEELRAMRPHDLEVEFPIHTPEQWRAHIAAMKVADGPLLLEGVHRRKDGSTFPVEVIITYMPFWDRDYTLAMVRDITERKQAEERRQQLQRSLIQSERMATVGTVAAGIVHNLRGPLTSIMGYGQLLRRKYPDSPDFEPIISSAQQMNQMIEDILDKSRQKKRRAPTDLNTLLQRELDFLQANLFFKHAVEKDIRLDEKLPKVECVYTDFSQVFGNLLGNAVDAMYQRDTKRLSVVTSSTGEHIVIEIIDTGCGIPEANIPRLFESFFTTKFADAESGEPVGTGLGLFMVRQLLEPYGAEIAVESVVNVGTTFRVKNPPLTSVNRSSALKSR